jgi:hypothetical protein
MVVSDDGVDISLIRYALYLNLGVNSSTFVVWYRFLMV